MENTEITNFNQYLFAGNKVSSTTTVNINSISQTNLGAATGAVPTTTSIGYRSDNGSQLLDGQLSEMIIYLSDQSSNRTGIETNINDFYSIY